MKAFKERFKKHCDYARACSYVDSEMGCSPCEDTREEGWRWAFESIRNEITENPGLASRASDVLAFINEELKQ